MYGEAGGRRGGGGGGGGGAPLVKGLRPLPAGGRLSRPADHVLARRASAARLRHAQSWLAGAHAGAARPP
eukprot:3956275-Pyramimonas_sp.AAC.1